MPTHKGKITVRQALIIYILSTLSPAIRLYPTMCAQLAEAAGWLSPVLSVVALIIIFKVFISIFQNKEISSLGDFFDLSLGKIGGSAIIALYLVWVVILYILYIRYYAERLVTTIFPNTSIDLYILIMMFLVFMATRGKLEAFARFCEFSILMFTVILVVFFIFLMPSVKIENLLPVTHLDILPIAKGTYPILGIWGYITFVFLMGDRIVYKDQLKKHSKNVMIYLLIVSTLIVLTVVGAMGYSVTARMPIPFFNAVKVVSFLETLDRLESVLLSIWVISDFIVVVAFSLFIISIMKHLFKISETRYLSSPAALLGYGGSHYLVSNRFELATFSATLGLSVNIAICFVVPIIIFAVGKIRKKI